MLSQVTDTRAARINTLGFVFIGAAFSLPFVVMPFGFSTPTSAGESMARTFGSLVFLAFISWVITRNGTPLKKANGRLIVGALLCATAAIALVNQANAQDQSRAQAKAFLERALEMNARQTGAMAELTKRFEAIQFEQVLTPENLVTAAGVANAKGAAATYRALVQQRQSFVEGYSRELDALVASATEGEMRNGAEEGMRNTRLPAMALYRKLDTAQLAYADSVDALLSFAARQIGTVHLDKTTGNFSFSSRQQQQEFLTLAQHLETTEAAHNKVILEVQSAQKVFADKQARALEKARSFIGGKD